MGIQVIGDEIHYDGELVAIMTTSPSATLMSRFCEALEGDAGDDDPMSAEREVFLDNIASLLRSKAKGGLLRINDLATVLDTLKGAKVV